MLALAAALTLTAGTAMIDVYGSKKHYTPPLLWLGILCWLGGVAMGVLTLGFMVYGVIRAMRQPRK